jgi:hypothetical protein
MHDPTRGVYEKAAQCHPGRVRQTRPNGLGGSVFRQGVSTILVFWKSSEKNPAEIAAMEDRNYLQGITANEIGYSRGITPAGKDFIMRHYDAYGGPKPPPIDHQGIDDAFIEKASVTLYFHGGKWLKLTGAD